MNAELPNIFDINSLQSLRTQIKGGEDPAALRKAAQQFEALFLQIVLKSMRDAVPRDENSLFDNDQSRMYESLLDQQLTQVMAGKAGGLGLAAIIEKQLSRQGDITEFPGGLPLVPPTPVLPLAPARSPLSISQLSDMPVAPSQQLGGFVSRMAPHAEAAERASGIPAQFMMAQAALETGWGRSEPRFADGRTSHNVFGIKADSSWTGAKVATDTREFVDGKEVRRTESFRAYGSYAEAFADYARLLTTNPRYASVAGQRDPGAFARALQQAGYATDPQYAKKLESVMAHPALKSLA